jgi:protein-tyrosine phosphatase
MVQFIDEQQQAGRITYVHCRNGVSRSGFVVIAYEMHKNHWTRNQALEFVRKKRPDVRPNPAFMERLLE